MRCCYVCGTTKHLITLAAQDDEESMAICNACLQSTYPREDEEDGLFPDNDSDDQFFY